MESNTYSVCVHSIFTIEELFQTNIISSNPIANIPLDALKSLIDKKKTRLCFSADIADPVKLVDMVKKVGPYICMLKVHSDILEHGSSVIHHLQDLAREFQFLLFEDRKFADIGKITKQQYKHLRWAHFVTVHLLAGRGTYDGIDEERDERSGVFLVAQMSSSDFDPLYTRKVVKLANKYRDTIAGIIAQEKLDDELFHLVPGINTKQKDDHLGQNYRTMDQVSNFADVIIVGSGIYNSPDPLLAVRQYASYQKQEYKAIK